MFDYHMHTIISFDGKSTPEQMVRAAVEAGLKEICFTDHIDHVDGTIEINGELKEDLVFDLEEYHAAYDHLHAEGLKIRRGMEYGITPLNRELFVHDAAQNDYDFIIGSVHFVNGEDVYLPPYWEGRTQAEVYLEYLQTTYESVKVHSGFDVLGHLTYICKCRGNPTKELLRYGDHRELIDQIQKELVRKGIGMEINTSGVDRCGGFLPTADYFRRFKELGGEIVTVGSDAHTFDRVGQYSKEACEVLKDIFGYVCTFEGRKPIFHKL